MLNMKKNELDIYLLEHGYKSRELEIIKEGKTGHGILIENDGFMYLKNTKENKMIRESIENGEWNIPHPFVVDAVFQKFGIKNANGRIYPEEVLKKQVEIYQQKIDERRALGELNHPAESTIDLDRIAINIIELHWENRTLVGKLEINTSYGFRKYGIVSTRGDQMANLLLNGYKIGVSSRGVGSVEQKLGQYIVGDDFELICWDVVSDPSTPGAYIGTQEELTQYLETDTTKEEKPKLNEKIDRIKSILNS
jgi:hypothetical protein